MPNNTNWVLTITTGIIAILIIIGIVILAYKGLEIPPVLTSTLVGSISVLVALKIPLDSNQ